MNHYIIIDGHNGEVTKLRLHYYKVGPIYQVPTFISMEAKIIQLVLSCNNNYICFLSECAQKLTRISACILNRVYIVATYI